MKTVLKLSVCILHRLSVSQGTLHILTSYTAKVLELPSSPHHQLPTQHYSLQLLPPDRSRAQMNTHD